MAPTISDSMRMPFSNDPERYLNALSSFLSTLSTHGALVRPPYASCHYCPPRKFVNWPSQAVAFLYSLSQASPHTHGTRQHGYWLYKVSFLLLDYLSCPSITLNPFVGSTSGGKLELPRKVKVPKVIYQNSDFHLLIPAFDTTSTCTVAEAIVSGANL